MSAPCPFCGFAASDYRERYNWCCTKCGKDYAGWLIVQKASTNSEEQAANKKPLFAQRAIPLEAEPVKFAQSLFMLSILALLILNFVIDGVFSWVYPVSIPLAGYYAFTIHKTGYALGQHAVYHRERNPIIYKVFLWGTIGYIIAAFWAWVN